MEALVLIPLGLIIYGWIKSTPSETPPPGVNGFDYPCFAGYTEDDTNFDGISYEDDDDNRSGMEFSDFHSDDYEFMQTNDSFDMFNDDFMNNDNDLFFDPMNSWFDGNIYHSHDDF